MAIVRRLRVGARAPFFRAMACPSSRAHSSDARQAVARRSRVLGIETSCDDTGVAVVDERGKILGQVLVTQRDVHAGYGGVMPRAAEQAHCNALGKAVDEALEQAQVEASELDAVAVTVGPGLALCLAVGVRQARAIAAANRLPIVPVHHMEAHALIARCEDASGDAKPDFPFLALLVSGGHNLMMLARGIGEYQQIGTTIDDALGEAYDKVARMLGLPVGGGGGPALEALALEGDPRKYKFSRPLQKRKNCDVSYAGLKTAVRLCIEAELKGSPPSEENRKVRADIAASFQRVAVDHLAERTQRAATWAKEIEPNIKHMVVAGGVASNQVVRASLKAIAREAGFEFCCPPPKFCTDNGVMVAWAGLERFQLGLHDAPPELESITEDEWVDVRPRWPLGERHPRVGEDTVSRGMKKKRLFPPLTGVAHAS